MLVQGRRRCSVATKVFRLIHNTMGSECVAFFVRLVALLRNRLYGLYFAPQASKRVETAWEGSTRPAEAYNLQKIGLSRIWREKASFKSLPNLPEASAAPEDFTQSRVLGP